MPTYPDRQEQIIIAHAALIVSVVRVCQDRALLPELRPVLQALDDHGQRPLAETIRRMLDGDRDPHILTTLDEDDRIVAEAILRGLQDPSTLPDPNAAPQAAAAAPGLASIIHAAAAGHADALQALGNMAEQMTAAGGDMARIGSIMGQLVNGDRDPDRLCKAMGNQAQSLVLSILDELAKLEHH
jgi:hypothetical protein